MLRTLVSPKEGFSISEGFKKPLKAAVGRFELCDLIRFCHPELLRFGVVKTQDLEPKSQLFGIVWPNPDLAVKMREEGA